MLHNLSTRGKYAIATILFILCAIISTMLIPFLIFETLYNRSDYIVLSMPFSNIQYFIYGMIAISLCLLLLTFVRKWYTFLLTTIVSITAIVLISISSSDYLAVNEQGISTKSLKTKQLFTWEEIDTILFEYESSTFADYIINLKDSSTFIFPHTGNIGIHGKRAIYKEAAKHNIAFVEKPK